MRAGERSFHTSPGVPGDWEGEEEAPETDAASASSGSGGSEAPPGRPVRGQGAGGGCQGVG